MILPVPASGGADRLVLIAHRGESERFPENTLRAFDEAIKAGAGLLECDVHLSADGRLVVIHDETLDRTTDRSGRVVDLKWNEIHSACAGYPSRFGDKFHECRVPLLDEVLELLRGRARLLIEVKPEAVGKEVPSPMVTRLAEALARKPEVPDVSVISFHWGALRQLRQIRNDIPLGILFDTWPPKDPTTLAREVGADFVICNRFLVTKENMQRMGEPRKPLGVYTVDDATEIGPLFNLGVRGIATNRYHDLTRLLSRDGWADRLDPSGQGFLNASA